MSTYRGRKQADALYEQWFSLEKIDDDALRKERERKALCAEKQDAAPKIGALQVPSGNTRRSAKAALPKSKGGVAQKSYI
jgi:hypothetical protein